MYTDYIITHKYKTVLHSSFSACSNIWLESSSTNLHYFLPPVMKIVWGCGLGGSEPCNLREHLFGNDGQNDCELPRCYSKDDIQTQN